MPPRRIVTFSDFDGTIATVDVGNLLYETFSDGSYEWPDDDWIAGRVSSRDCLIEQCACTRATREQLEAFVDAQELDPAFPAFVEYCRSRNHPLYILSDGMDFYVHRLLERAGLGDLPVFANHLEIEGDRLVPSFPYHADTCGRCANCKGPHVRHHSRPHDLVVYVGDGWSDPCGAEHADVIFAKGGLRSWCERTGRPFFPLTGFAAVLAFVRKVDTGTVSPP